MTKTCINKVYINNLTWLRVLSSYYTVIYIHFLFLSNIKDFILPSNFNHSANEEFLLLVV